MCIEDPEPGEDQSHYCVQICPVCSIFTPENVESLLFDHKIDLGPVETFVEVAQLGCRMCLQLCTKWGANEEVRGAPDSDFYTSNFPLLSRFSSPGLQ